jgi:carbon monoxide dehydrogenase subunit G
LAFGTPVVVSYSQQEAPEREAQVKLENSFDVPAPPDVAWRVLTDIERVVPCVPGAELTDIIDARNYTGKISVRLGPVSLAFDGSAEFTEWDDAGRRARLKASGREARNRGSANADVVFALEADGDGSRVHIVTDLQLAGPIAQYGRSQGVIASVSEEMIDRFAACLREKILSSEKPSGAGAAPAQPARPASGFSIGLGAFLRMMRGFFNKILGRE